MYMQVYIDTYVYMNMHIVFLYVHVCVYIYIYLLSERERDSFLCFIMKGTAKNEKSFATAVLNSKSSILETDFVYIKDTLPGILHGFPRWRA